MKLSNLAARVAAAAFSVAIIACTDSAPPEPDPNAAAQIGEAEPLPHNLPPPSETNPRYVGLWAANAEGCADPAWRWEANNVSTQGEVSCTFNNVAMTPTGYTIAATCHAEGDTTNDEIQLSFAESARAMMIAGGPWSGPTGLVYCSALPTP